MTSTIKILPMPGLQACRACTLRGPQTFRVVPGYGNLDSKLMIVAQSPGAEENAKGIPLVGKSGMELSDLCARAGIPLETVYRTNVNKCHPRDNRKATAKEILACSKWLNMELEALDPDVIVTLGDSAYRVFLPDEKSPITQIQGSVFKREINGRERTIIPAVHPAFVIRNPIAYRDMLLSALVTAANELHRIPRVTAEIPPFRKHAASMDEVLDLLKSDCDFGFDLETSGLHRSSNIIGIGVCAEPGNGLYYPIRLGHESDLDLILPHLKRALEDPNRVKIVSNALFERHIMHSHGVTMRNYRDTLTEAWLLGTVPLSLKDATHHVIGLEMIRISKFAEYKCKDWRGVTQLDFTTAQECDPEGVAEYAAQDPDASLRLHRALFPRLQAAGLESLYMDLELPFTEAIFDMELAGMGFDSTVLDPISDDLRRLDQQVMGQCSALTGFTFNPASVPHTIEALYTSKHSYTIPAFTPTKKQKAHPTDRISLGKYIGNPLVRGILTVRGIRKLRSYVVALPTWVDPADNRIHPNIKQTGTETGRVSCANPNLMNIPARKREDVDIDVEGAAIRRAFVARPGHVIMAPDYSQVEMRVAAHLSGDPTMVRLLCEGADLHDNTARAMYKKGPEDVTPEQWKNMRFPAKTVGFGVLYGLEAMGLIIRTPTLKLTVEEARQLIDAFYAAYPGLKTWQDKIKRDTARDGYASTILGRRRYLPDITATELGIRAGAERAAINVPVQGSAADIFKLGILVVRKQLIELGLKTRLVSQVHDEIVMEGPEEEVDIIGKSVIPLMTQVYPLSVPLKVDFEYGQNWGALQKWNPK